MSYKLKLNSSHYYIPDRTKPRHNPVLRYLLYVEEENGDFDFFPVGFDGNVS